MRLHDKTDMAVSVKACLCVEISGGKRTCGPQDREKGEQTRVVFCMPCGFFLFFFSLSLFSWEQMNVLERKWKYERNFLWKSKFLWLLSMRVAIITQKNVANAFTQKNSFQTVLVGWFVSDRTNVRTSKADVTEVIPGNILPDTEDVKVIRITKKRKILTITCFPISIVTLSIFRQCSMCYGHCFNLGNKNNEKCLETGGVLT